MDNGIVRKFETGATRDTSANKLEPFGFISPLVMHRFSEYMHKHRFQSDGTIRSADNWQKGIPIRVYLESITRHFFDFWLVTTGFKPRFDPNVTDPVEIACALLFNIQGFILETMKADELDRPRFASSINEAMEWAMVDMQRQGVKDAHRELAGLAEDEHTQYFTLQAQAKRKAELAKVYGIDPDLEREVDKAFEKWEGNGALTNQSEMGLKGEGWGNR
jgi:hypothetical protein